MMKNVLESEAKNEGKIIKVDWDKKKSWTRKRKETVEKQHKIIRNNK